MEVCSGGGVVGGEGGAGGGWGGVGGEKVRVGFSSVLALYESTQVTLGM